MLLILSVAVGGKIIGGSLGARLAGEPWRPALAIGSLRSAGGRPY
jgi:Kef-type K+ transport system membrane component KefB